MNSKKLYSDEFEINSLESNKIKKRFFNFSTVNDPINEDIESENQSDYLSDFSSSSTFSLYKKRMSLSLSKFIDKLEPNFSSADCSLGATGGNSKYRDVGETIVEEDDD